MARVSRGTTWSKWNFPPTHERNHTFEPYFQTFKVASKLIVADNWERPFWEVHHAMSSSSSPCLFPSLSISTPFFTPTSPEKPSPLLVLPQISCPHKLALYSSMSMAHSALLQLRLHALVWMPCLHGCSQFQTHRILEQEAVLGVTSALTLISHMRKARWAGSCFRSPSVVPEEWTPGQVSSPPRGAASHPVLLPWWQCHLMLPLRLQMSRGQDSSSVVASHLPEAFALASRLNCELRCG